MTPRYRYDRTGERIENDAEDETPEGDAIGHRAAEVRRALHESQASRVDHEPGCERPRVTTEAGYSVDVSRCHECGATSTARRTP